MQSYKEDVCVHAKTVKKEEKEGMETAQGAGAESETPLQGCVPAQVTRLPPTATLPALLFTFLFRKSNKCRVKP